VAGVPGWEDPPWFRTTGLASPCTFHLTKRRRRMHATDLVHRLLLAIVRSHPPLCQRSGRSKKSANRRRLQVNRSPPRNDHASTSQEVAISSQKINPTGGLSTEKNAAVDAACTGGDTENRKNGITPCTQEELIDATNRALP
jgi:hypothetical protein